MSVIRRFLAIIVVVLAGALAHVQPLGAQNAPTPPASSAAPSQAAASRPDAVPADVRAALDGARAELTQLEAALRRRDLSSSELQDLRGHIDPISERLTRFLAVLGPRYEAAKARLDQLGPKPKEGAPAEGPEVARDRAEREATAAQLDEAQRLARTLLLQAEQLTSFISDRRRNAFTHALFERSYSIVSPSLWLSTGGGLPRDLRAVRLLVGDWASRLESRATPATLILLGLALGAAIAVHSVRRQLAPRLVRRAPAATDVNRRRRVVAGAALFAVEFAPAAGGAFLLYQVLDALDLAPPRLLPVLAALLVGVAFMAFIRAAMDALFAPNHPEWRIVTASDATAKRLLTFSLLFGFVVSAGRVLDALGQAIAAGLALSIATRAVTAALAALVLAEALRRFASEADDEAETVAHAQEPERGAPIRTVGWILVAGIALALLSGYVALASFLVTQIAWIASLGLVLKLAISVTDELLGHTLSERNRLATALQVNLGLRRRALLRAGVLGSGIARVLLALLALLLALAPWGVESGDLAAYLRAAFFGFKVGDVTFSLSTTAIAIVLFGATIAATRVLQRWLDRTFLPTTDIDAGLRNSIGTAVGYLGFFAAAAVAFGYLGVGLERVAFVAGALSVGIGFGLQSIVNNFVSGLILLWERPIRVGDLVVVGDGEGYVRRINVRATEIETLDRSTIIVPNSNLISGTVKNRVRDDQSGRATVAVNVLRNQDPARAAELLRDIAAAHPEVRKTPAPLVFFRKIGDTWLEFELICVVNDVSKVGSVQSDLNFKIFEALVSEGILPPLGPGAMNVGGLEPVETALREIAASISTAPSERAPRPSPPSPA